MDNIEAYDNFYAVLFEPYERVCWSRDIYGTTVVPVSMARQNLGANFFSINPLIVGRLDANVTCFRNILLEFDDLPLREQTKVLNNVPWSTMVFSGGKSYHAVISLEQPCETREEYDALVQRILKKVPDADTSTKNPSRFSRAPLAMRGEVKQKLVAVGNRVSRLRVEEWLGPEESPVPYVTTTSAGPRFLRGSTQYFLGFGAPDGQWNRELFLAALDMARAGHAENEIVLRLAAVTGKLDKTDRRTIRSALSTVAKEQK